MTLYRRPKALGTVVRSISSFDGRHCIDIFQRPDLTFGFEEYRRDAETGEGWFPIGHYSGNLFATKSDAIATARKQVGWLDTEM